MKILVTGAKGFVGKNLCTALYNLKNGKDRTRPNLCIEEVFEYDIDTEPALLDAYCKDADFVFNLAGVNRPQTQEEFMQGNFGFASTLLATLKKHQNRCPVMLSSSIQATLIGRYADGEYGKSKKAGEELNFGGLLGEGPIMDVNLTASPAKFINRGGRIPAPMQSLKN